MPKKIKEGRKEEKKEEKMERRKGVKERKRMEKKKLLQILNFLKVYNIKQNEKICLKCSCKLCILRGQIGF